MDYAFITKMTASLLSALAAWWGFRKFKAVLDSYREVMGPRAAQPFTSFVYRWSGEEATPLSQELILHLGNRENRQLLVKEIIWFVPALRVKWPAETQNADTEIRLGEGEGVELIFNPSEALASVEYSEYFRHFLRKLIIITSLRLVVTLQTGERISLRAPSGLRSFLASKYALGKFGQGLVRLHHRIWP